MWSGDKIAMTGQAQWHKYFVQMQEIVSSGKRAWLTKKFYPLVFLVLKNSYLKRF
jgi:hypothetical protein